MAPQCDDLLYRPDLRARKEYARLYPLYRGLTDNEELARAMYGLREISTITAPVGQVLDGNGASCAGDSP